MTPGEILTPNGEIELNADCDAIELDVANTGDRPIQVGSHFGFFEVNRALHFDRKQAFNRRLDIPAGTAVRFEPGETKSVTLITVFGNQQVLGLNALSNGANTFDDVKTRLETWQNIEELA